MLQIRFFSSREWLDRDKKCAPRPLISAKALIGILDYIFGRNKDALTQLESNHLNEVSAVFWRCLLIKRPRVHLADS